jgi:hypothetical protein
LALIVNLTPPAEPSEDEPVNSKLPAVEESAP